MITDALQRELDRYYAYGSDRFVRYTHRVRIDRIVQILQAVASPSRHHERLKILDAGTGFGIYALVMAEAGCDVTAFDINDSEITRARQWASERGLSDRIDFRTADLRDLPEPQSGFDVIVCSEVLEHLDDPSMGALKLFRALRPGGMALISMPNMACLHGLLQIAYRKSGLRSLLRKPPLDLHQLQHSRYWFGNILKILKGAGFEIVTISSINHIPFAWTLDQFCESRLGAPGLVARWDHWIGRLPYLGRFGFNLIVQVRRP